MRYHLSDTSRQRGSFLVHFTKIKGHRPRKQTHCSSQRPQKIYRKWAVPFPDSRAERWGVSLACWVTGDNELQLFQKSFDALLLSARKNARVTKMFFVVAILWSAISASSPYFSGLMCLFGFILTNMKKVCDIIYITCFIYLFWMDFFFIKFSPPVYDYEHVAVGFCLV